MVGSVAGFDAWRRALVGELSQRRIDPRDAARLVDELETHHALTTERLLAEGMDAETAVHQSLRSLGTPRTVAGVAETQHRTIWMPLPLLFGHAIAPTIVLTALICAASVFAAVLACGDGVCNAGRLAPAAAVASGVLALPPILAAWMMLRARRALLSERWGWVSALLLGITMAMLDLHIAIAWPRYVDVDVVVRSAPSLSYLAAPLAAAAVASLLSRTASAYRYARLMRSPRT